MPLNDLYEISCNIRTRVNDRIAAGLESMTGETTEAHWLIVLREELDLAKEEARASDHVEPNTYKSGYDQGWADAIRMIVDATSLLAQAHPASRWHSTDRHRQPAHARCEKVSHDS
jgi:hypothetical protein